MNARDVIDRLRLRPHPEAGWYAETWRGEETPRDAWQKAVPVDGWVLVGCTVSPGFEFAGFRLAEPGWSPDGG